MYKRAKLNVSVELSLKIVFVTVVWRYGMEQI